MKAAIHPAFFRARSISLSCRGLSGQGFRFRKWPVFSGNAILGLGLDHLVEPAANKNSEVLLYVSIFSVTFLGVQPQAGDVRIPLSDQLELRFGRGGVTDLRRISEVNM